MNELQIQICESASTLCEIFYEQMELIRVKNPSAKFVHFDAPEYENADGSVGYYCVFTYIDYINKKRIAMTFKVIGEAPIVVETDLSDTLPDYIEPTDPTEDMA